jgi:hypothetical protein
VAKTGTETIMTLDAGPIEAQDRRTGLVGLPEQEGGVMPDNGYQNQGHSLDAGRVALALRGVGPTGGLQGCYVSPALPRSAEPVWDPGTPWDTGPRPSTLREPGTDRGHEGRGASRCATHPPLPFPLPPTVSHAPRPFGRDLRVAGQSDSANRRPVS